MRLSFVLISATALLVAGGSSRKRANDASPKLAACECDSPACPPNFMSKASLCACLNNAALFCWRRNGGVCASPIPQNCNESSGNSTVATQTPVSPTYTPPHQGSGGINCVEIGYCSRPTKARTTITVTGPNGTAVITVPVGLPTEAYVPKTTPTETTPIVEFTPGASKRMIIDTVGTQVVKRTGTPTL